MNLVELIMFRRTVHNYKSEKVPAALVEKALELSLWAPNHKLTFPWAYFEVGSTARRQLAELSVELKEARGAPLSDVQRAAVVANVMNPSHLILVGLRKEDAGRAHEDFATLACSVQIASLYLAEQGVGSKWSTGGYSTHRRAYEILGVSPDAVVLEGALMIGVAQNVPAAPARPALDRVLTRVP